MAWWVIPEGVVGLTVGQISRLFETGTLGGAGTSGVGSQFTIAESATRPQGAVAGPFPTAAAAQARASGANTKISSATTPSASNLTGLTAIGDFFQRLTQEHTWVRVAEFAAGGIMLLVGLKAFFPQAVSTATSTAKKAAKAAPFL